MGDQCPDDADMGEPAGGAAAQCEPDYWPPDTPETHLVATVLAVLAAPDQYIQHLITPGLSWPFWPRPINISST